MTVLMEVAQRILETEARIRPLMKPPATSCIITWRDNLYIGAIQRFEPGAIFLTKSTKPIDLLLIEALRSLDRDRLELSAPEEMDLEGKDHLVDVDGDRIVRMSPTMTAKYLARPPDTIIEVF